MGRSAYQHHNQSMVVGAGHNGSSTVVSAPNPPRRQRTAASQQEVATIQQIVKKLNRCTTEKSNQVYELTITEAYRDLRTLVRGIFGN